jgi:hypothetical protein
MMKPGLKFVRPERNRFSSICQANLLPFDLFG